MYFGSIVTDLYSQYNQLPLADTNSREAWGTWRTPTLLSGTTMPPCSWIGMDITVFCLGLSHQDTCGYQSSPIAVVSGKLQLTLPLIQAVWEVCLRPSTASDGYLTAGKGQEQGECCRGLARSLKAAWCLWLLPARTEPVFSSIKWDLSCIPCHLLCHRWYKLVFLHHETPVWSRAVQPGRKEQWQ